LRLNVEVDTYHTFAQLLGALSVFLLSDYVTTPVSFHVGIIPDATEISLPVAVASAGRSHGTEIKYRACGTTLSSRLFTVKSRMAYPILFHYRQTRCWLGMETCWLLHSHFVC